MNDEAAATHPSVYLVGSMPHEPANPSGTQNLQTIFGLDSLAASVARTDAQGNKIAANKLNKTYKKQVLDLGLPGEIEIPKNRFLMDMLLSGAAHREVEGGYKQFTAAEIEEGFSLRPGELNGYVKYRPPSPTPKRMKTESAGGTPTTTTFPNGIDARLDRPRADSRSRTTYSEPRTYGPSRTAGTTRPSTPSPIQTRSTAHAPPPPISDDGNDSSDDGSRFKQLERERKKKLRMKREADMALGGDYKRRRYDVDGYEFLDSD